MAWTVALASCGADTSGQAEGTIAGVEDVRRSREGHGMEEVSDIRWGVVVEGHHRAAFYRLSVGIAHLEFSYLGRCAGQ